MKYKFTLSLLLWCFALAAHSQISKVEIDSTLESKITVDGFCLCKTTLNDLKNLSNDFKSVEVEEMDYGKRCMGGIDSRFDTGKGYYSEKYPGIIFQKDKEQYISKIRLTKDYVGKLPDGTAINMKNILLKDIIKIYPELDTKWGSRDCSDYWSFSNDTLSFFVKIDKNKQPQYPVDKKYYMDKPIEGIDLLISCYSLSHKNENFSLFSPNEPMYFIDSIRVNQGVLETYQPTEFAFISIYKDANAIRIAGPDAKNGLIYLTTKRFARHHFWSFFKSKSEEYKMAVSDIEKESKVTYILNDNVLVTNFEKELFEINDNSFFDLKVIDKYQLKKKYNVSSKSIGVVIKTK